MRRKIGESPTGVTMDEGRVAKDEFIGFRFLVSAIKNFKQQNTNTKWFDKPFDRLTVLSKVEGLTTLSQVERQITMTEIQNPKQLAFDLI